MNEYGYTCRYCDQIVGTSDKLDRFMFCSEFCLKAFIANKMRGRPFN